MVMFFPFDPSKLAQLLPERLNEDRHAGSSASIQDTYAQDFSRLLRVADRATSAKSKAHRVRTGIILFIISLLSTYHSTLAPWEIKIGLFIFVGSRAMILFHVGL